MVFSGVILSLFVLIFVSCMVPKKNTFQPFVRENSQVSSSASSLGITRTEQTTDISEDMFMRVFSTSPTTAISEAELKSAKVTEDFSRNVFMRKMGKSSAKRSPLKPKRPHTSDLKIIW